ncbi:hypothetical protein SAMN04487859_101211 [Roseovarius lutimaris]|uniref:Uncharacterized protein n=1 Tax=Roseovarius lutimaris TaxID=1005928 RepID=A0A1I4YGF4_9RHOB|nr:hypothetical protein [Roseovarius lutimaris]SFN37086.1 hypothetical protein SAMN04487859_101211 [Roseovarius lutimaris]
MRLYRVSIKKMHQHPEYGRFVEKMSELNAKHPDYGGGMNGALVRHHTDPKTVKAIVAEKMSSDRDIVVEEVTIESLEASHVGYRELVERYFLPYDEYPEIE